MLQIINNTIYLTRGDSAVIDLTLTDTEGTQYDLSEDDKVELVIKSGITERSELVRSTGLPFELTHDQTKDLPYGGLFYDVQVTFPDGSRDTVIAPSRSLCGEVRPNFYVTEEVNWT